MGRREETARRRKALLARDGSNCGLCGGALEHDITIDHILAKRNGGTNRMENLRLAHRYCNQKKNQFLDQKFHIIKRKTAQLSANKGESMNQISVTVTGESRVEIAKRLRAFADNLDGTPAGTDGKVAPKKTATTAAETEAPAKAAPKKTAKAPAEEEEQFDLGEGEAGADEEPAVTKKDLIAACRDNREAAIKVLKKMKVNSVHELKPTQYAKVLAEIGA